MKEIINMFLFLFIFIPMTKGAIPGTFFWKPRLGLDLTVPTTEMTTLVLKPSKANIKSGMVVMFDGYQAGISVIAMAAGLSSADMYLHLNPISAFYYTNTYRWALRYISLPPKTNKYGFIEEINQLLSWIPKGFDDLLLGDMNIDILCETSYNSACVQYINNMSELGMQCAISDITREEVYGGLVTRTCIDHTWDRTQCKTSAIPFWLGGQGGHYCETHRVWKRRFYYMDEFVPQWLRNALFFVKKEEWEKEEQDFKQFKKYAEPAFGKHFRYPKKHFNNFKSQLTEETQENLDKSSIEVNFD